MICPVELNLEVRKEGTLYCYSLAFAAGFDFSCLLYESWAAFIFLGPRTS